MLPTSLWLFIVSHRLRHQNLDLDGLTWTQSTTCLAKPGVNCQTCCNANPVISMITWTPLICVLGSSRAASTMSMAERKISLSVHEDVFHFSVYKTKKVEIIHEWERERGSDNGYQCTHVRFPRRVSSLLAYSCRAKLSVNSAWRLSFRSWVLNFCCSSDVEI